MSFIDRTVAGGATADDVWAHPDSSARRMDEGNLLWTLLVGRALSLFHAVTRAAYILVPVEKADWTIETIGSEQGGFHIPYRGGLYARFRDMSNNYAAGFDTPATAGDFYALRVVAGTATRLGTEAVDLSASMLYHVKVETIGTTIRVYRDDMATPKITATDTSIARGYFGLAFYPYYNFGYATIHFLLELTHCKLYPPSSPAPKPIAYFQVPIVGSGAPYDPFRPTMPEELAPLPEELVPIEGRELLRTVASVERLRELGLATNRAALTHSSLIPTDTSGRPKEYIAIVKVFDQPYRQPHLRPIPDAIAALSSMPGVRRLTREEAIKLALKMDDKLTIYDLEAFPKPTKSQVREYVEWRRSTFKTEMSEEGAEEYLKSEKGW